MIRLCCYALNLDNLLSILGRLKMPTCFTAFLRKESVAVYQSDTVHFLYTSFNTNKTQFHL